MNYDDGGPPAWMYVLAAFILLVFMLALWAYHAGLFNG